MNIVLWYDSNAFADAFVDIDGELTIISFEL